MTYNRILWFFFRIVRKLLKIITGYRSFEGARHIKVQGSLRREELLLMVKKIMWYAPDTLIFYLYSDYAVNLPKNARINEICLPDLFILTRKSQIFTNFFRLHRCIITDPSFFDTEECVAWSYLYGSAVGISAETEQLFRNNFSELKKRTTGTNQAVCFLTGESFSGYRDFPQLKNMVKVICNSVVKNTEFLEYIRPDILCFADPVYHFSYNEYAVKFRDDVIKSFEKYDFFIIIPENMVPLMLCHYPRLKNRLIGIKRSSVINFPEENNLSAKTTDNILTYMMLPAASALADEVFLLGADGRSPDDKMFWKHNSSVQYDSLMQKVVDAHPSFFRDRNYVEYQSNHDKVMESLFKYGELVGKKYISLNKSYLNSVNSRYKGE